MLGTTRRPGLHLGGFAPITQSPQNGTASDQPSSPSSSSTTSTSSTTSDNRESSIAGPSGIEDRYGPLKDLPGYETWDLETPITTNATYISPETRYLALQKLAEGHTPSSLGTVLPSPHPDYLKVLYLGSIDRLHQFIEANVEILRKGNLQNPYAVTEYDNDHIIYLPEWHIENVMKEATEKVKQAASNAGIVPTIENDEEHYEEIQLAARTQSVRVVQWTVAKSLARAQQIVFEWQYYDEMRKFKESKAMEVIINDPSVFKPGALENDPEYWREKLGWIPPATEYWLDPGLTARDIPKFKFVAFGPTNDGTLPDSSTTDQGQGRGRKGKGAVRDIPWSFSDETKQKYIWSNVSGTWRTPGGLEAEEEQVERDRNNYLKRYVAIIERDSHNELYREQVGFVSKFINGTQQPTEEEVNRWVGGKGAAEQKATTRRKVKGRKQTPTRGISDVRFVPEDGGLPPMDALAAEAAQMDQEEKSKAQEEANKAAEEAKAARIAAEEAQKAAEAAKEAQKEAQKKTTGPKKTGKGKKKAAKTATKKPATKPAPKEPKTTTAPLPPPPAMETRAKRKRDQVEENDEPAAATVTEQPTTTEKPTQSAKEADVAPPPPPAKKAKPTPKVKEETPAPPATRKSSRIAKRKATEEPESKLPAPVATKKRKTGKEKSVPVQETREPTVAADTTTAASTTTTNTKTKTKQTATRPILKITTTTTNNTTTTAAADTTTATSDELQGLVSSLPITPAATPHKPTTQTLAVIPAPVLPGPITTTERANLITTYPFLSQLPDPSAWIEFLRVHGHHASIVAGLNEWFTRAGAMHRQEEYRGCLERAVARIMKVVGEEDKYVLV